MSWVCSLLPKYLLFRTSPFCRVFLPWFFGINEPRHDKTICAPSKDSDQPEHPPSLIRNLAVRMKKAWVLSYPLSAKRRLWSDWADAQADPSLRWAHSHFVGFVISRLKWALSRLFQIYNTSERSARGREQCFINHYCSWTDSIQPSRVYLYYIKNDFFCLKGNSFSELCSWC